MKVLICNTLETKGGAARVSKRIYQSVKNQGVDAQYHYLFEDGRENDSIIPIIDAILRLIFLKDRKIPFSTSLFSFNGKHEIDKHNPDILHLNYINMGMLSIKEIGSFNIPIVWTLHDSWAFTGGFHLPQEVDKNLFRFGFDLSEYIKKQKQKHWKDRDLTFVCPSKWMYENVKRSEFFTEENTVVIPNPIDTKIFKPMGKEEARRRYSLDLKKKYILFGSVNPLGDRNKGFDLLRLALENIKLEDTELLIFGTDEKILNLPIRSRSLGYIKDEKDMAALYSAVDLTIVPSRSENFPTALVESLSCGTPVTGFDVGGIPEIISKKEYGKVVKSFDTKELGVTIKELLLDSRRIDRDVLHKEMELKYGYNTIGKRYRELYERVFTEQL